MERVCFCLIAQHDMGMGTHLSFVQVWELLVLLVVHLIPHV